MITYTIPNYVNNYREIDQWILSAVNHDFFTNNGENVSHLPPDFEHFNDFHVIDTIPDGSCLIHSILLSLSPLYSKIVMNERSNVGKMFRKTQFIRYTKHESLVSSDYFLDDRQAGEIADWLDIVIIMFDQVSARINQMNKTDLPCLHAIGLDKDTSDDTPVIFVFGSGCHFETLCYQRRTVLSLKDAKNIPGIQEILKI